MSAKTMSARILDGQSIATEVLEELREPLRALKARGRVPKIVSVQVAATAAAEAYTRGIRRNCEAIGIRFESRELNQDSTAAAVSRALKELGEDPAVTGVMIQFPLPSHLDGRWLQAQIPPDKDVEGITPTNLGRVVLGESEIAPCTALATLRLLEATGVDFKGAECVVVGMSEIVGKPSAILIMDRFATTTVCHVETRDLARHTRNADILVVATGKPGLIEGSMIKPGAAIIDIGYTRVEVPGKKGEPSSRILGDVVYEEALEVASWITPVPGGVGPVTRAMLMRNAVTLTGRD